MRNFILTVIGVTGFLAGEFVGAQSCSEGEFLENGLCCKPTDTGTYCENGPGHGQFCEEEGATRIYRRKQSSFSVNSDGTPRQCGYETCKGKFQVTGGLLWYISEKTSLLKCQQGVWTAVSGTTTLRTDSCLPTGQKNSCASCKDPNAGFEYPTKKVRETTTRVWSVEGGSYKEQKNSTNNDKEDALVGAFSFEENLSPLKQASTCFDPSPTRQTSFE